MDIIGFLENNLLSCPWKEMGMECTGCGLQRSMVHLLKGEFIEAFFMYPAIYTLLIMFAFLGIHLKYNFEHGARILKWLFLLNLAVILAHYISKLI
jgi:hypothetical protein